MRLVKVLLVAACCATTWGAAKPPAKKTPSASSVTKTLLQMEREWSQAGANRDSKTMDRILAEDWVSVDFRGNTVTKAQAMTQLASSRPLGQSIELGEMKVRIFGTTAVVLGKDSHGAYAWMDVFVKRDGRWQAVASQSTKIEK